MIDKIKEGSKLNIVVENLGQKWRNNSFSCKSENCWLRNFA